MQSQRQIRQDITNRIVSAIESGVKPWRRSWRVSKNCGRPANVVSKKPYSGVNPLLLEITAMQRGFSSKFWGTFRQWDELGCSVQKRPDNVAPGGWGTNIVFCKPILKTVTDETGEEEEQGFFMLKTYTVFNADQVSGAERFQVSDEPGNGTAEPDYGPAEELIAASGADIRHGGEKAYYSPGGDFIQLPNRERFGSLGAYYETAIHELAHWSEPRQHFDRQELGYPMCELIAEMSACFVASEIGIPNGEGLENHASYIRSWLDAMKGDSGYIFRASKLAGATCDFLMAFVREPEPEEALVV
jgi:antirestriction protein ArdC